MRNLKEQQAVLLELLHEFDRICKKHRIPYVMFCGSAIGAVRHNGIIPWDDDLDVSMLRNDYERFLKIAPT
jgi:lipopolysaccharide cholinephosphotransferase